MSSSTTLTINMSNARTTQAWRRNQNTVRHQLTSGLGPVSHTVLIAIMLCVLGLIYLTQITKTSAYGYQINDLKNKKEQLLTEKRDLEVESARLQALERVKNSDVAKALTAPAQTDYAQN
jgi:cell division protein FtsL